MELSKAPPAAPAITTFYAHSREGLPESTWELLIDHLQAVAARTELLARQALVVTTKDSESQRRWKESSYIYARIAGLLHDLGKYLQAWQRYLRASASGRKPDKIPHSIHGANYALRLLRSEALALAIAGHHSRLADFADLDLKLEPKRKDDALGQALNQLLATTAADGLALPPQPAVPDFGYDPAGHRHEFWTRFLFSLLIDADRLETERFKGDKHRQPLALDPAALLAKLDRKRRKLAGDRADMLNLLRNRVFDDCVSASVMPQGFFDLTVPTGGGKTYAAMAFALQHALIHGLRRVIVVIPYLSIIEQNARVYKKVFGKKVVIEHHSAAADTTVRQEGSEPTQAELATENWDAPIIVTTSVQFLETLLAASTKRCRKLHSIARSVVIFDEAQTLPIHILNPLMSVFRELVTNYGTSIVFSTATQPAFRQAPRFTEGLREGEVQSILTPELCTELFHSLRRVRYHIELDRTWSWGELVARMAATDQGLCVLNTRAHARTVWESLRATIRRRYGNDAALAVRHLSSAMCPQHRLDMLGDKRKPRFGTVHHTLDAGQPCWLVSTQAIEAGVDISFNPVFKALGPFPGVVQTAGRCNREGTLVDPVTGLPILGDVYVFIPTENNMPGGAYLAATGKARTFLQEILEKQEDLATDYTVFARYFTELFGCLSVDAKPDGEPTIQSCRSEFKFRAVARRARVIKDDGRPVIVPYVSPVEPVSAPEVVAAIRKQGKYNRHQLRQLQRFTVDLRDRDLDKLFQLGQLTKLLDQNEEDDWLVLAESAYDPDLGVVIADQAPADADTKAGDES